jgi:hypothetical protein
LFANAEESFAKDPVVESLDILAAKVPAEGNHTRDVPALVIDKWYVSQSTVSGIPGISILLVACREVIITGLIASNPM